MAARELPAVGLPRPRLALIHPGHLAVDLNLQRYTGRGVRGQRLPRQHSDLRQCCGPYAGPLAGNATPEYHIGKWDDYHEPSRRISIRARSVRRP